MYDINKITQKIQNYNLKKILETGERNMLDEKLNKDLLKECFEEKETETKKVTIDLAETLENQEEKELFDSIINLKEKI